MLEEIGYPMELTAEEAWPNFRGWRVNYETNAYRLADRVVSPPAPWSGPRTHLRSGPVAPRRPPQRSPAGKVFANHRPEAQTSPARRRGSPTRPRQSPERPVGDVRGPQRVTFGSVSILVCDPILRVTESSW